MNKTLIIVASVSTAIAVVLAFVLFLTFVGVIGGYCTATTGDGREYIVDCNGESEREDVSPLPEGIILPESGREFVEKMSCRVLLARYELTPNVEELAVIYNNEFARPGYVDGEDLPARIEECQTR